MTSTVPTSGLFDIPSNQQITVSIDPGTDPAKVQIYLQLLDNYPTSIGTSIFNGTSFQTPYDDSSFRSGMDFTIIPNGGFWAEYEYVPITIWYNRGGPEQQKTRLTFRIEDISSPTASPSPADGASAFNIGPATVTLEDPTVTLGGSGLDFPSGISKDSINITVSRNGAAAEDVVIGGVFQGVYNNINSEIDPNTGDPGLSPSPTFGDAAEREREVIMYKFLSPSPYWPTGNYHFEADFTDHNGGVAGPHATHFEWDVTFGDYNSPRPISAVPANGSTISESDTSFTFVLVDVRRNTDALDGTYVLNQPTGEPYGVGIDLTTLHVYANFGDILTEDVILGGVFQANWSGAITTLDAGELGPLRIQIDCTRSSNLPVQASPNNYVEWDIIADDLCVTPKTTPTGFGPTYLTEEAGPPASQPLTSVGGGASSQAFGLLVLTREDIVIPPSANITPSFDTINGGKEVAVFSNVKLKNTGLDVDFRGQSMVAGWTPSNSGTSSVTQTFNGIVFDTGRGANGSSLADLTGPDDFEAFDTTLSIQIDRPKNGGTEYAIVFSFQFKIDIDNYGGMDVVFDPDKSSTQMQALAYYSRDGIYSDLGSIFLPVGTEDLNLRLVRFENYFFIFCGETSLGFTNLFKSTSTGYLYASSESDNPVPDCPRIRTILTDLTVRSNCLVAGRLLSDVSYNTPRQFSGNIPRATLAEVGFVPIMIFGPWGSVTDSTGFEYTLPSGLRIGDFLTSFSDSIIRD